MNLCDNDHSAIAYESGSCPLCRAIDNFNNSESEAEDLRTQLNDKQDVIDALTSENEKQARALEEWTATARDLEKENDTLTQKIIDLEDRYVDKQAK